MTLDVEDALMNSRSSRSKFRSLGDLVYITIEVKASNFHTCSTPI